MWTKGSRIRCGSVIFTLLSVLSAAAVGHLEPVDCRQGELCHSNKHKLELRGEELNPSLSNTILRDPHPELCDTKLLQPPNELRIWLFSALSCDIPDTWVLLQHWYKHYRMWGFNSNHMLLVVHKNLTTTKSERQCKKITKFLKREGVPYTTWNEAYHAPGLTKLSLRILLDNVVSPHDWIAYADSDEFHDYGAHSFEDVRSFTKWLEANKYDAAQGKFRDHVTSTGVLAKLQAEPIIWDQYGLECDLTSAGIVEGRSTKTVIYRAYYRTGNGNHDIVPLHNADAYFGPYPPGSRSPRSEFYGSEDIRQLTPYKAYSGCYTESQETWHSHPSGYDYFKGIPNVFVSTSVKVHHFKWHQAVIANARLRLQFYAGDMLKDGKWDWSAKPRMSTYFMSQKILETLENGSIPLQKAHCWGVSPQTVALKERLLRMG